MSDHHDPWLDDRDAPNDLREALGIARQDDVTRDQLQRLHARLTPVLGLTAAHVPVANTLPPADPSAIAQLGSTPSGASASLGNSVVGGAGSTLAKAAATKWLVVVATLVTSGVFGAIGYYRSRQHDDTSAPVAIQAANAATTSADDTIAASTSGSDMAATDTSAAPTRARETQARAVDVDQAKSTIGSDAVHTNDTVTATNAGEATATETQEDAPRAASQAAPHHTATPGRRSASVQGGIEDEARLLKRAQAELVSSPDVTLRLTQEHARRFAHGLLAQERDVLAIEALARLGREAEARARLARFTRAYPGSPHARRAAESVNAP